MEKNKVRLRPRQRIKDVPKKDKRKTDASSASAIDTATSSANDQNEKAKASLATSSTGTSSNVTEAAGAAAAATAASASSSSPRTGSPEPNCAICLGKLENKSFTDSCFHMFCFVCLVEWSKVKAECPLCKQSFKSIVHNVRNYEDYEQYHIPRPEDAAGQQRQQHPTDLGSYLSGVRFRYRTTVTDHRYAHIADRLDREISNRLFHRPSQREPHYRRRRQVANSDFRRSVYQQKMRLSSEKTTRRRVRETSPTFFRDNTAQTHRLVPWLNRELNALLPGHGEQSAFVMELIMDLIKRYQINSEEFHQHVYPFIGRNTRQFMNEFLAFAKSPFHMAAYDRHVTYQPNDQPSHDSESDQDRPGIADDGNDSDVIVVSPSHSPETGDRIATPPSPRYTRPGSSTQLLQGFHTFLEQPPFFHPIVRSRGQEDLTSIRDELRPPHRFDRPPCASGWDSPTHGSNFWLNNDFNPYMPQSTATSCSIWTPSSTSFSAPTTPLLPILSLVADPNPIRRPQDGVSPGPSTSQGHPIVCHETESDSDTSDVQIVNYEKPWTERSPIKLSSAEESDPDLVIVGMTHVNDPVKKEKKKKRRREKDDKRQHSGDRDGDRTQDKRQRKDNDYHSTFSSYQAAPAKSPERHRLKLHIERRRSRSRSRTRSSSPRRYEPLKLRLHEYRHKKFSYYNDEGSKRQGSRKHETHTKSHSHGRKTHSLSSSESEPETESTVSIRSRKHRSNSRHSSIEILEFRKKSSKFKKIKKHKKDRDGHSSERKKHKKDHKKKSDDSSKSKKSKKKHKKVSPNEMSKTRVFDTEDNNKTTKGNDNYSPRKADTISDTVDKLVHSVSECTSDSEPDSDIDVVASDDRDTETDPDVQEETTTRTTDKGVEKADDGDAMFESIGLEFVELSSAQAAAFDEELENINASINQASTCGDLVFPNLPKQKPFKKHPHGHKKSSKMSSGSTGPYPNQLPAHRSAEENVHMVSSLASLSPVNISLAAKNKHDDIVQSNDITSSDIDVDKYLPSFLSFVDKTTDYNNMIKEQQKLLQSYTAMSQQKLSSGCLYGYPETPSTSVDIAKFIGSPQSASPPRQKTLSESSTDIDVTGTDIPLAQCSTRRSSSSDQFIEVCDPSDTGVKITSAEEVPLPVDDELDIVGVSDSESVVEYLGEEKASIDITGDSETESDAHTIDGSDSEIDIVAHSEDEIKQVSIKDNENCSTECSTIEVRDKQYNENYHSDESSCHGSDENLIASKDTSNERQLQSKLNDQFSTIGKKDSNLPNGDTPMEVHVEDGQILDKDNVFTAKAAGGINESTSTCEVVNDSSSLNNESDDNTRTYDAKLDSTNSTNAVNGEDSAVGTSAGGRLTTQPAFSVGERAQSSAAASDTTPTPQLSWTNNPLFEPASPNIDISWFSNGLSESFTTATAGSSPRPDGHQYISTYMYPQSPSPGYPPYSPDFIASEDSMAPED